MEVEPAFTEYLADLLNERRAKYVARAIDHHLDWTYEYYERVDKSRLLNTGSLRTFRFELFSRCPELQIMWDISDGKDTQEPGIENLYRTLFEISGKQIRLTIDQCDGSAFVYCIFGAINHYCGGRSTIPS